MLHVLVALLALQAQEPDEFWYGPLGARAHAVYQLGGVGFVPDAPTSLKDDTFETHITFSSINIFNNTVKHNDGYLMDMEFERLNVDMWYGVSDRFQVGIMASVDIVNGGVLDDFIIGFHRTFGINQGGRTEYRRDATEIIIQGKHVDVKPAAMFGDMMLVANYKVFDDPDYPQLMVGTQIKLPTATANILYDSHGPGVGLSANLFYQIDGWYANIGASGALVGDCRVLGDRVRPYQLSLFAMVEKQLFDDVSMVAQIIGQSGLAKSLGQYSIWSWETDVGFKFHVSKRTMFEVGIYENIVYYANSADFGAFASYILRF